MGPATADETKGRGQRGRGDAAAAGGRPRHGCPPGVWGGPGCSRPVGLEGGKVKCPWVREERPPRPLCRLPLLASRLVHGDCGDNAVHPLHLTQDQSEARMGFTPLRGRGRRLTDAALAEPWSRLGRRRERSVPPERHRLATARTRSAGRRRQEERDRKARVAGAPSERGRPRVWRETGRCTKDDSRTNERAGGGSA